MIGLPHSSVTVIPPAVLPDGGASVPIAVPVTAAHRQRRRHFYAAVLFDKGIAFVKQRSKNRTQDVRFLNLPLDAFFEVLPHTGIKTFALEQLGMRSRFGNPALIDDADC